MARFRFGSMLILVCSLIFSTAIAQNPVEAIFYGGDILTMDDRQPTAQAVGAPREGLRLWERKQRLWL